jgi:hypothetical protein
MTLPKLFADVQIVRSGAIPRATLQTAEDHRAAIDALFGTIEKFLAERDSREGARRIFARYEQWLKRQDWYGPSSPSWLPPETN